MTTIGTRIKKTGSSARPPAAEATAALELKPNLIRCRAYEIFLGRNGGPGDPVSDWIQAERELKGGSGGPADGPREPDGLIARSGAGSPPSSDGILDHAE